MGCEIKNLSKNIYNKVVILSLFLISFFAFVGSAWAQGNPPAGDIPAPTPKGLHSMYKLPASADELIVCSPNTAIADRSENNSCPNELNDVYDLIDESCATSYNDFLSDPVKKHFWVEDPNITAQGKSNERARQFLYWALNTSAIDNSPVITEVWRFSSSIALFGVVLVGAIFGIGYIVSQRTNYDFKIRVWPTIIKLGSMLLFVALSYAIIFTLIQFGELLMNLSLENLGGRQLFNIYFSTEVQPQALGGTEKSYLDYFGCRDLNIRVQEGIDAEVFMLQLTNVSYYVMGVMLLLRKILLWFLLFAGPFLAILMPFIFIRNTGWIWIGVFFQWLFYGPLLALFLGAMAKIWEKGIPWSFDFSRVDSKEGYIYPTAIFLLYGGPAQTNSNQISALNNASYADTFAEYVISLLMIWAVTFFPWFLLRIFRDYCCDGIYASKNILMAIYDNIRNPKSGGPISPAPKSGPSLKLQQDLPKDAETKIKNITVSQVKTTNTSEISKSLLLSASKITDIAKFETNKETRSKYSENLKLISNPVSAQKPADRQLFMNLRSELFSRAIKNDKKAQSILQATSTSISEKTKIKEMILKSLPTRISITQIVSKESKIQKDKVVQITNNFNKSVVNNEKVVNSIAKNANTTVENVKNVIKSYSKNISQPVSNIVNQIASETNNAVSTVKNILNKTESLSNQAHIVNSIAGKQNIDTKNVTRIIKEINTSLPAKVTTDKEAVLLSQKEIETIKNVMQVTVSNEQVVQTVATETKLQPQQVISIITSYASNIKESPDKIIEKVKEASGVSGENIKSVIENVSSKAIQTNEIISKISSKDSTQSVDNIKSTLSKEVENLSLISKTEDKEISTLSQKEIETIKNVMQVTVSNEQVVQTIATETKLQPQQVRSIITSYVSNIKESPDKIIEKVKEASGIAEEEVKGVLDNITGNILESEEVVSEVALQENVSAEQISDVVSKQIEVAKAPEQHIEKTISIPQSVSIEDYEEVKEMWAKQYEEGEVPVSENIKSRADWVSQEIVILTNTLNKIMSDDLKLQQQGLDELGFILPIFLINSLKGEELVVYLKAKLEAAKLTIKLLAKEESVREKIKQEVEEEETVVYVDAPTKKQENTMSAFSDEENADSLKGVESRVKAVQEKLKAKENSVN